MPPPPPSAHTHDQLADAAAQLARAGRFAEAWQLIAPHLAGANARLLIVAAGLRLELGDVAAAIGLAQQAYATATATHRATAASVLGDIYRRAGNSAGAEAAYRDALAIEPAHAAAAVNLARLLASGSPPRLAEAESLLAVITRTYPDLLPAACNLATARLEQGNAADAFDTLRPVAARTAEPAVHRLLAMIAQYDDRPSHAELDRLHQNAAAFSPSLPPTPTPPNPAGKPVLAFVSPDFRDHPVPRFLLGWLSLLKSEFRIVCVDLAGAAGPVNAACRAACDVWIDASAMSDTQAAHAIRAAGTHAAIDLAGLTAGSRPGIFALRPAPIQLSAIGYPGDPHLPGTIGWLGDRHTATPGSRCLALDRCFLCYLPELHSAAVGRPPSPPHAGPITFASFNALSKVSSATLELWRAVLDRVPDAVLLIKSAALDDPPVASRFLTRAAAAGLPSGRLRLSGRTPSHAAHLAAYESTHIALDTFPYHGTTTTCEALSMGIPVVTLEGERPASRVGPSILHALSEPSLIARTPAEYASIAAALAADRPRLALLRAELPRRLASGELCDAPAYARSLASLLRRLIAEAGIVAPYAPHT